MDHLQRQEILRTANKEVRGEEIDVEVIDLSWGEAYIICLYLFKERRAYICHQSVLAG